LTDATGLPCETDEEAETAAAAAIARTNSAILLTRSERGISYFERDKKPLHLKTAAQDVFDVSGAGDTVMALAALGTASRLPVSEMIRLANTAAGIVVSKLGTAVVSAQDLDEALEAEAHQSDPSKGASLGLEDAVRRRVAQAWAQGRVYQRLLRFAPSGAHFLAEKRCGGMRQADRRDQQ
jgi:D-beta-D-heptose 7-phosphate kinase/D-beta-D-heptose 1-phosphate adenosyltransferase